MVKNHLSIPPMPPALENFRVFLTMVWRHLFFSKSYPVELEEVKHNKQKEARIIDTLEPVLNQHKLIINKDVVIWDYNSTKNLPPEVALKYQLMYQISRITRDRGALAHDDRLDCLTMAVGYWVKQMGQDVDKRIAARNDTLMKLELEAWDKGAKSAVAVLLAPAKGTTDMKFSFSGVSLGVGMGNNQGNHHNGWMK